MRERERETDRQTDRQTERHRERHREGQREGEREKESERERVTISLLFVRVRLVDVISCAQLKTYYYYNISTYNF